MRTCEAAARAVLTLAAAVVGQAGALRDPDGPTEVAASGQIVVRTPSPAVLDQTLSPVSYWIEAEIPVELYAAGSDATARAARLDAMVESFSAVVQSDRTLGGIVGDAEVAFADEATLTAPAGEALAAVALVVRAQYQSQTAAG